MTQASQQPGSGGTPAKKDDKPVVLLAHPVRIAQPVHGQIAAANKVAPPLKTPASPDNVLNLIIELVPLDQPVPGERKQAHDAGDQTLSEDLESLIDVILLDRPPTVKKPAPPAGLDWLADIELPRPASHKPAPQPDEPPDWMADVAEIEAALRAAPRPSSGTPLDWLADVEQAEGPRARTTPKAVAPPPTELPALTPPSAPPRPAVPPTKTVPVLAPPVPLAQVILLAAPVQRLAPAVPLPVALTKPPLVTEDQLVKREIAETGCDPITGQILDQAQYDKWSGRRAAASAALPTETTESVGEVYRNARNALERWVDDDSRQTLILTADVADLQLQPEVQAILDEYRNYGAVMRDKLLHHFEYLVTNRRRYYTATMK